MPRVKKQRLKKRADGYYVCRYRDQWFYSLDEDEALAMREEYKRLEKAQLSAIPTVRSYGEAWLKRAHPSVAPPTMVGLRIHLRKLTDALGDVLLTDVKPSQIKEVFSSRYVGLSNSYIRAGRQVFEGLFAAAVADGILVSNPVLDKTAKPHRGTVGGHRQITPQERVWIETLCTDHRCWPAVMAMLYAGLRPQEMKALKIDRDVDFKAETITLRRFVHVDGLNYKITASGKTEKAARSVPLFPPLKAALSGRSGFLMVNAQGERVNVQAWKSAWASYVSCMETAINGVQHRWYGKTKAHKAILAAGGTLPPWIPFTVVPYDLRHSFCCMCRDNGVELNTCIRWMGHVDAKMILKIYDEASDLRSEKEAEKLKKSLFRSGFGSGESEAAAGTVEK